MPDNLNLLHLLPYSPELNPVENIWQYIKQNFLSNRIDDGYDAIVDACRAAGMPSWQCRNASAQLPSARGPIRSDGVSKSAMLAYLGPDRALSRHPSGLTWHGCQFATGNELTAERLFVTTFTLATNAVRGFVNSLWLASHSWRGSFAMLARLCVAQRQDAGMVGDQSRSQPHWLTIA